MKKSELKELVTKMVEESLVEEAKLSPKVKKAAKKMIDAMEEIQEMWDEEGLDDLMDYPFVESWDDVVYNVRSFFN